MYYLVLCTVNAGTSGSSFESSVSMSSMDSVENSFISPGDVLTAGVTAVQEVLAGQDDVVYLNQVLTAGVTGVTEVLASDADVITLDQVLTVGVTAVEEVLATDADVITLDQVLTVGVTGVTEVLASDADVITLDQVLTVGVTAVQEVLAGQDDVVEVGQVLVAEILAKEVVLAGADDVINLGDSIAAIEANVINIGDVLIPEIFAVDEVKATLGDVVNEGEPLKITARNAIAEGDILVEYVEFIPDVLATVEEVIAIGDPIFAREEHVVKLNSVMIAGVLAKDEVLATDADAIMLGDPILATEDYHLVTGITQSQYDTAVTIVDIGEVDASLLSESRATIALNFIDADRLGFAEEIIEIGVTVDGNTYDNAVTNVGTILSIGHPDLSDLGAISHQDSSNIQMSVSDNENPGSVTSILINKANVDKLKLEDFATGSTVTVTVSSSNGGSDVIVNITEDQVNALIKMYSDILIKDRLDDADDSVNYISQADLTEATNINERGETVQSEFDKAQVIKDYGKEISNTEFIDSKNITDNNTGAVNSVELGEPTKAVAADVIVAGVTVMEEEVIPVEEKRAELADVVKFGDLIKATEDDVIEIDDVLVKGVEGVDEVLATESDVIEIGEVITALEKHIVKVGDVLIAAVEGKDAVLATEADVIKLGSAIEATEVNVIVAGVTVMVEAVEAVDAVRATEANVITLGQVLVAGVEGVTEVLATAEDIVEVGDVLVAGVTEVTEVLATADDVITLGQVLLAGVEGVTEVLATADDIVEVGDVLVAGVTEVTEVLATADDVITLGQVLVAGVEGVTEVLATADDAIESFASEIGMSESDMWSMTANLSEVQKTAVITKLFELNSIVTAKLSDSDESMMTSIGFAFASDPASQTVFDKVIADLNSGKTTMDEVRIKTNPDANSVAVGATTGITIVNNTVSVRQEGIVTASNRYGLRKYSGVNSGSSSLDSGAWLKVIGSTADMGTRQSVAGYEADSHGVVIGVDKTIGNIVVGGAFSYVDTDTKGKSILNLETQTKVHQGTLYGAYLADGYVIDGSVAYGRLTGDTKYTGLDSQMTGSYGADIYSVGIGFSAPIDTGGMAIIPKINMSYSKVSDVGYTEAGVEAKNIDVDSMNMFNIQAGTTIQTKMSTENGVVIPKLRLIADLDMTREEVAVNSSWVSNGAVLPNVTGVKPSALGGIIGVGVEYVSDDDAFALSVGYDAGIRPDFLSHSANAKIRVNF